MEASKNRCRAGRGKSGGWGNAGVWCGSVLGLVVAAKVRDATMGISRGGLAERDEAVWRE